MFAGGYPGDGRWRKASRGVGDAAPYGLPGNGRQRKPAPHPALRGHLPPRGKARVVIPPGVLAAAEGRGGVGAPRPTDGDMETLWGLRGQPFPGRRAVGAGHARPGGWREHPSMVRSVGRGLDPSAGVAAAGVSAGGNPGKGANASLRGASGTPPPTGCPGTGGSGRSRRGEGTPPYGWGYGNAVGFTRAAVPGAPRGRGRACPARGLAWAGVPVLPPHPAHISTGV